MIKYKILDRLTNQYVILNVIPKKEEDFRRALCYNYWNQNSECTKVPNRIGTCPKECPWNELVPYLKERYIIEEIKI